MSWSFSCIGKPAAVIAALCEYGKQLAGQSSLEFERAKPHLIALAGMTFSGQLIPKGCVEQVIDFEAAGHSAVRDGKAISGELSVSIKPTWKLIVGILAVLALALPVYAARPLQAPRPPQAPPVRAEEEAAQLSEDKFCPCSLQCVCGCNENAPCCCGGPRVSATRTMTRESGGGVALFRPSVPPAAFQQIWRPAPYYYRQLARTSGSGNC